MVCKALTIRYCNLPAGTNVPKHAGHFTLRDINAVSEGRSLKFGHNFRIHILTWFAEESKDAKPSSDRMNSRNETWTRCLGWGAGKRNVCLSVSAPILYPCISSHPCHYGTIGNLRNIFLFIPYLFTYYLKFLAELSIFAFYLFFSFDFFPAYLLLLLSESSLPNPPFLFFINWIVVT